MYHLLVTGNVGAWDLPAYEYPRERFCEYTSSWLVQRFSQLSATAIEAIKAVPALFIYEGEKGDVRVGYIRNVREGGRSIRLEYQFDQDIPAFPFAKLKNYTTKLHIEGWELGRTHWAIKEVDLFDILTSAGIIGQSFRYSAGQFGKVEEMQFKVALSFPGEHREYVAEVAKELRRRLPPGAVFYDKDFSSQLARPNLDTLLQRIYLENSDLVVVFLSADYQKKKWCGIEWRAIRQFLMNRADTSLMFMRFDDASVEGSFETDGYIDLRHHTPQEAAEFVIERIRLNEQRPEAD